MFVRATLRKIAYPLQYKQTEAEVLTDDLAEAKRLMAERCGCDYVVESVAEVPNMANVEKKVLIAIAVLILVISLIDAVFGIGLIISVGRAEDLQANAWILRRPETDNVLIQKAPGRQPYEYWRIVDNDPPCGAEIMLTGQKNGKWLECMCCYLPGKPVGWVHSGFVVFDKPVPCEMVATVTRPVVAKESIGGRDAWECVAGERVKVLYRTEEWSTTIWGMVPTNALDFTLTGEVTQPRRARWKDWTQKDHLINVVDWW